ncbi:MAG: hypothetical protein KDC05_09140 [Bacteroidales bacterium]|nr:hypothetical protein [Bacteroidales bacterium]
MKAKTFIIITLLFVSFGFESMAQDHISPARKQAIDSLALEKVRDLSKYITLIGDKETEFSEAQRVIDRAVELFMEGSEVGVSSLFREGINYYEVREYFERLMRLNYSKVDIEWYKIEYVSDLERQPDGTYVGVITIFQKFSGYDQEGGLVYEDVTKKDITVYVKRKETQIAGKLIGFWDVLLGDIRVKETSKE